MPAPSISSGEAYSTAQASAMRLTSAAMRSRSAGETCLESLRPAMRGSRGSTTAPTASGPATGPRPTSSRPTQHAAPRSAMIESSSA